MYKVTLFDQNCPSCCSGTASFYCDNIDEFEREWIKYVRNESQLERFRRSKNGECVTDYYSDDPELDVVQFDGEAIIYHELEECFDDLELEIHNSYMWPAKYFFKKFIVSTRFAEFKGQFLELAKYRAEGTCMENWLGKKKYCKATCWGNSVLNHEIAFWEDSDETEDYADDLIESFVYFKVRRFDTKEEMNKAFEERKENGYEYVELDRLMMDIPGEAG